jgi:hypothetical protein
MRNARRFTGCTILVCGAALTLSVIPTRAWPRQDQGTQYQNQNQNQNDNDLTRQEVASFDRFLDGHPAIEQDLTSNPSLVNDTRYLQRQPDLQAYLNTHVRIRMELQENPSDFMRRESRFEGSQADRDRGEGRNPNPDLNQREVGRMDQFLDDHPGLEQQLQQNPALINDSNFLTQHQDLQLFLNAHPQIREEFDENPAYFMRRENRFEGSAADRDQTNTGTAATVPPRGNGAQPATGQGNPAQANPNREVNPNQQANPNPDLNEREVGRMDQFFDDHPGIEKNLQQNPSLINNDQFLDHNRALAAFLNEHPGIREEFAENPNYFMQRENRFEDTPADRDRTDAGAAATARGNARASATATAPENAGQANPNPDLNPQQVGLTDQFFDDHPKIEKALEKNPSLINNDKFVDHNRDLSRFLNEHPRVREEFAENPNYFMRRENEFEGSAADRDQMPGRNPDANEREMAQMDQFLDQHPKLNKELEKNPSLIDNDTFLNHNRDLSAFLSEHPAIDEQFHHDPGYFMHRENEFEGSAADHDASDMHKFLEKHKSIAKDLDKDPAQATDDRYLAHHKDLRRFFDQHQQARLEFVKDPHEFMNREHRFDEHNDHRLQNQQMDKDKDKNLQNRADLDHRGSGS